MNDLGQYVQNAHNTGAQLGQWANTPNAPAGGGTNGQMPLTNGMLYQMLPTNERNYLAANGGMQLTPDQEAYARRMYRLQTALWNQGFADAGNNFIPYLQQQYGDDRVPEHAIAQIEQQMANPQSAAQFANRASESLRAQQQVFSQGGLPALTMYQQQMGQRIPRSQNTMGQPQRAGFGGNSAPSMGRDSMYDESQPFNLSQMMAAQQPTQQENPYAGTWYSGLPSWQQNTMQRTMGYQPNNYGAAGNMASGNPWSPYNQSPQYQPAYNPYQGYGFGGGYTPPTPSSYWSQPNVTAAQSYRPSPYQTSAYRQPAYRPPRQPYYAPPPAPPQVSPASNYRYAGNATGGPSQGGGGMYSNMGSTYNYGPAANSNMYSGMGSTYNYGGAAPSANRPPTAPSASPPSSAYYQAFTAGAQPGSVYKGANYGGGGTMGYGSIGPAAPAAGADRAPLPANLGY